MQPGGPTMATPVFGDTNGSLTGHLKGAAQALVGTNEVDNTLYCDAATLTDFAHGGADTLTGGELSGDVNLLVGDSDSMSGTARGGRDILIGGNSSDSDSASNTLYGDAAIMSDSARGDTDNLIGGNNSGS